jgi:hypothetical protein
MVSAPAVNSELGRSVFIYVSLRLLRWLLRLLCLRHDSSSPARASSSWVLPRLTVLTISLPDSWAEEPEGAETA